MFYLWLNLRLPIVTNRGKLLLCKKNIDLYIKKLYLVTFKHFSLSVCEHLISEIPTKCAHAFLKRMASSIL